MNNDNRNLFYGPGYNSPFDNLKLYIDKQIGIIMGMIGTIRYGTAAPTANDIPAGKYAVWYNTTSSTIGIYYNNAGTVTLIPGT